MKILLFGGTTEGRILTEELVGRGHAVTVSVATPVGAEPLSGGAVRVGRLGEEEMAALLPGFNLCVDATHPYARQVSGHILAACRAAAVPLRRVSRTKSAVSGGVPVESCQAAAAYLAGREGNILLTIGTRELGRFACLPPERVYARVLPTREAIAACEAMGLPHRNIIALWGPFSRDMNLAILRQYSIRWMVTKDSGDSGGFPEKLAAAREAGTEVLVVRRPEDEGCSWQELLEELEKGGET